MWSDQKPAFEFPKKKIFRKNVNVFQRLSKPKKRYDLEEEQRIATKNKNTLTSENTRKKVSHSYKNSINQARKESTERTGTLPKDHTVGH